MYIDKWTKDAVSRASPSLSPAIFGIALIVLMYVLPDGVVGGTRRLARQARRRLSVAVGAIPRRHLPRT